MNVFNDVDRLNSRISLPEGVQSATWTVIALGVADGMAPGPTDTRLHAMIKLSDVGWQALGSDDNRSKVEELLPKHIAQAILPSDILQQLPEQGDDLRIEGLAYDAEDFNKGSYRGVYAVRREDYILVCLQTQ